MSRYPRSWRIRANATGQATVAPPEARPWYRFTNVSQQSATLRIFDEVGFWGITASDFARELEDVTSRQLDVFINSAGGECFDGFAIFEALRRHPANVTVYVDGLAASIASVIAMAGDRIVASMPAQVMIHQASGTVQGTADDMTSLAGLLTNLDETIAEVYANRAGGDVRDWLARMKAETWFTSREALAVGLVDEIAGAPAEGDGQGDELEVAARFDMAESIRSAFAETFARPAARTGPALPADRVDALATALQAAVVDYGSKN